MNHAGWEIDTNACVNLALFRIVLSHFHPLQIHIIQMHFLKSFVLTSFISLLSLIPSLADSVHEGKLLIVGGGLRESSRAIHEAFLEHATRADGTRKIGILPCASSNPVKAFHQWKSALIRYGVNERAIVMLPIAVEDDASTESVDESTWRDRAADPAVVDLVRQCSAIWMTGGDQTRLANALIEEDGSDTPVLKAMREQYHRGMLVAGTSAGAAILSHPMIAGGSSDRVWFVPATSHYQSMKDQEQGALVLAEGFGFFGEGLIDQHFDRKSRFARLVFATLQPGGFPIGFGIDEDTALLYLAASRTAHVIGSRHVFRVDATKGKRQEPDGFTGIRIDFLADGDHWELESGKARIHPEKKATVGSEYMDIELSFTPSLLTPYSASLADALSYLLLDNASHSRIDVELESQMGNSLRFSFFEDADSRGFWATLDGQYDSYSGVGVSLEIRPASESGGEHPAD